MTTPLNEELIRELQKPDPDPDRVDQLVAQGADPNFYNDGRPPLYFCAKYNLAACARVLLEKGGNTYLQQEGFTAIEHARPPQNLYPEDSSDDILRVFIDHGLDFDYEDPKGNGSTLEQLALGKPYLSSIMDYHKAHKQLKALEKETQEAKDGDSRKRL